MKQIVLLRGINVGASNRVAMPALRAAFAQAGYADVRTHLQSGNIVLDSELAADALAEQVAALLTARFDLQIPVLTRSARELAEVVAANPLADEATDPKRYQVSFLSAPLAPEVVARLSERVVAPERLVVREREVFAWHPDGIARSKLWNALAGPGLGVTATARNWSTVQALLELADS